MEWLIQLLLITKLFNAEVEKAQAGLVSLERQIMDSGHHRTCLMRRHRSICPKLLPFPRELHGGLLGKRSVETKTR